MQMDYNLGHAQYAPKIGAVVGPVRPIRASLDALTSAENELADRIGTLASRLGPVLGACVPECGGETDKPPSCCDVEDTIDRLTRLVRKDLAAINDLIDRLRV